MMIELVGQIAPSANRRIRTFWPRRFIAVVIDLANVAIPHCVGGYVLTMATFCDINRLLRLVLALTVANRPVVRSVIADRY